MITGHDATISYLVWDAGYASDDREISNNLAKDVNLTAVDDIFFIVTEDVGFEGIDDALSSYLPDASHWTGGAR